MEGRRIAADDVADNLASVAPQGYDCDGSILWPPALR